MAVAVVIPDAGPLLTLARLGRLDLLEMFDAPIHIVDQVHWEVTKPTNDPTSNVRSGLRRLHNRLTIVETVVGAGFQAKRSADPNFPSRNLGELAVEEYAMRLRSTSGPAFIPLILFEDPDVLEMPIAKLKDVHLLNTTAWLFGLFKSGRLSDGLELIDKINQIRATEMRPFEKQARTKKIRSLWQRRIGSIENT